MESEINLFHWNSWKYIPHHVHNPNPKSDASIRHAHRSLSFMLESSIMVVFHKQIQQCLSCAYNNNIIIYLVILLWI